MFLMRQSLLYFITGRFYHFIFTGNEPDAVSVRVFNSLPRGRIPCSFSCNLNVSAVCYGYLVF